MHILGNDLLMTLYHAAISFGILAQLIVLWKMDRLLSWKPAVSLRNWRCRAFIAATVCKLRWPSRTGAILALALTAELIVHVGTGHADTPFTTFSYPATLPNRTGSTPTSRTTPERLGPVANVIDFGAKGDSSTDDTAAIQAAVNWQTSNDNRGSVYFPVGRYIVSSPITIPPGSFHIFGDGVASAILASGSGFNGYVFDQLTTPYNQNGQGIVIERLNIQNSYAGQNANQAASSSWSAGSNVTISVAGLPSFVGANCLTYIIDQKIAPMPVFVGVTTSVVANTSITLGTAAVGSSGITNLNLAFVQSYLANGTWTTANSSITMATTPPAGVPTHGLVYDYDRILFGDGTNANVWTMSLGYTATGWSGTTVSFTTTVSQGSAGASDRLIFAPAAGCIRLSSTVSGTVRDCVLTGFIGITTSEVDVNTTGQQSGAESYSVVVQGNKIQAAGHSAATGGTALYLTNNSSSIVNDINAFWVGTRISGLANSIIGGRHETCYYGIAMQGDQNSDNIIASANLIASHTMESNAYAVVQIGGGSVHFDAVNVLCQNSNGQFGLYLSAGRMVISASSVQGNWAKYAIYVVDAGNVAGHIAFIGVEAANFFGGGSGAWRTPVQAWWGTCTFANLPTGSGSPAPVQGETYDISDCNTSTFLATAAGGGTGASAHRRVRWNAAATAWQVVG
jgi:hypothetical protein